MGLAAAAALLSGVSFGNNIVVLIWASLIFSVVNAVLRPLVIVLALPAVVLTLGLFIFVVNALMLYLVTVLYPQFVVDSFWQSLLAVIIVWLINYIMTLFLREAK